MRCVNLQGTKNSKYIMFLSINSGKNNIILILYTICIVYLRYANAFAE